MLTFGISLASFEIGVPVLGFVSKIGGSAKMAKGLARSAITRLPAEEYVRKLLELDLVPVWLQKVSGTSQQADLDQLSAEEIDAEIAAARTDRHKVRLQLGS